MKVFLHEQAHSQIVMRLIVVILKANRLFIVVIRFLKDANREIGIAKVLEQFGLLLELQAFL